MDYVLQETQRNRQLANHIVGNQIAYRTFAANGVNDGVFTTGPKVCVHLGRDFVNYLVSLIQYGSPGQFFILTNICTSYYLAHIATFPHLTFSRNVSVTLEFSWNLNRFEPVLGGLLSWRLVLVCR